MLNASDRENVLKSHQAAELLLQCLRDAVKTDDALLHELGMSMLPQATDIAQRLGRIALLAGAEPRETPGAAAQPDRCDERSIDALLKDIAHRELGTETLEARNRDALDFYSLSVWRLRDALRAAFEAGWSFHKAAG
ncbi:MAG: DUF6900 domain-containing protein [Acidiferrobacterales bacterium]